MASAQGAQTDAQSLPKVGVIGAGRSGTAVARLALARGHVVRVANAHGGDGLRLILEVMAPGAVASGVVEAITNSDIIMLAIPLNGYRSLPAADLAGKIVVDMMNYWRDVDGVLPELESGTRSSSEVVQAFLPASQLVKTLNHIDYAEMSEDARPPGSPQRRALAIAGDDPGAKGVVQSIVENLGFDVVDAGPLSRSRLLEPGSPLFSGRCTAYSLRALLAGTPTALQECSPPFRSS